MTPKTKYYETLANTMIKNFEKRRMEAYYYPTAKEAVEKALSFLPSGAVVAHGGSMTLEETGMMDALRSADIQFLDRAVCKTPEDSRKIFHDALMADYYFMSTNAMTIDGELVNIDGNGNRVAAISYGPKEVIVIAGSNKIVRDAEEARKRVKEISAPANAMRLDCNTPCTIDGICRNCASEKRICCTEVLTGYQRIKNRIKVIIVDGDFGF